MGNLLISHAAVVSAGLKIKFLFVWDQDKIKNAAHSETRLKPSQSALELLLTNMQHSITLCD